MIWNAPTVMILEGPTAAQIAFVARLGLTHKISIGWPVARWVRPGIVYVLNPLSASVIPDGGFELFVQLRQLGCSMILQRLNDRKLPAHLERQASYHCHVRTWLGFLLRERWTQAHTGVSICSEFSRVPKEVRV